MVVDGVEGPSVLYVRSTGFDEAWRVNTPMSFNWIMLTVTQGCA